MIPKTNKVNASNNLPLHLSNTTRASSGNLPSIRPSNKRVCIENIIQAVQLTSLTTKSFSSVSCPPGRRLSPEWHLALPQAR